MALEEAQTRLNDILAPSTLTTDDSLDNPDDLTCAICLCQPDPVDIAIIKGCEHSYCVKCILHWALFKDACTCPQCKHPFNYLFVHRQLDGTISDYATEESVCLLKRATWFTQHIHTLDKGALLGAFSFDQEHAYDEDDYEYDDEVEDEEESYYFSSASGRSRVVLGNRRFGENGFVRGGRLMARPVQSPGPSYSTASSSSSSSASSKQVGAQGSIKKTGGSSSSKAAGPAHAHNKYGSTGIGKPGNSVCVKNQSAAGGPINHKQVASSTLQVASMADAPPCAPDEVGLLAKGTGSSSVKNESGASGIHGSSSSSSSSSLPTPSSVAVPKQGNGSIAPSTWEDEVVAAGSTPLTPMYAVVAVERTQSVQNQQMSSFSSCSRQEAVTELSNQVSEAISTCLPSGTSLGLIDTLYDHEPDHLLGLGGSSDPLNKNIVLTVQQQGTACTSDLLSAQAEANTSTPQPSNQKKGKDKKAAQQAGSKKKGSNYKKQHPNPCPDGQCSDHNFGVSAASGEAIPSISSSVTLAMGTGTTVPSSVSHVSSCDNEALTHNSSAASAHNSSVASAHNSRNNGISRSGRRVSTRRAKDIARTFEEDYLVR